MLFFPRSAWAPPSMRPRVDLAKRERVVVHHTAILPETSFEGSIQEMFTYMRRLQRARPDLMSPVDVPYQLVGFFWRRGLVVIEGLGLDRVGAHVAGKNTTSIGIAFAGDFEGYEADDDSFMDHALGFCELKSWLGDLIGRDLPWEPHQEHKATACPGSYILHLMAEAELPF